MQIEENKPHGKLSVTAYEEGVIEVDAQQYRHPFCLTDSGLHAIEAESPQTLDAESFLSQIGDSTPPEVILVGTGNRHSFLHPKITAKLASRGIGLESMSTAAACRTFMILQGEGRRVWAWLWP
ncbi:MAG: Mth938-like domain-containing protein [Neisseria sp.]|uniref:Mth938-like domain-containing protein n=1 Tax=Neisseria sp. TaxID=192066 RepID=UPI0026DD58D9|nr:Mth938-like domain-containing protein [Neisseria sp.]MDO4640370.1 Mth938-like domain-containing protein [Neisseria sp.]